MKARKIFIVLAATAAISLAVISVAYGYYVSNQTRVNPNSPYATNTNTDFWGWFRGCFGFRSDPNGDQYRGNSTIQPPANVPPPQPYQPQNPNYGYYQYGYRRGCCGW